MENTLLICGMLAGGLGLFMLAVSMITDGLKSAAGHALRDLLGKWTHSPARGIAAGFSITAIVQSSSAVTIATIGFVNAGLITMYQALGVVYGANIGTTITGWLVALIGFEINIDALALPIIGLGTLLRLTGGTSRRAPLGLALIGFGLFFIGIDVLKDAFGGLVAVIDLNKFTVTGATGILMYVGIGFLMTVLTQSSSAAIAITLTAATGGVLGLHAAAAMVIGANIGTTSTALLAVIGATSNARRVAAAHIIFNLTTGAIALLILPVMFQIVELASGLAGVDANIAVSLALFHTTFNVLGVAVMFPFTARLARFLDKRFVTRDEVEGRPRYLDKSVVVSPTLAVNALTLELTRITTIVRRMQVEAADSEFANIHGIASDHAVVQKLSVAVSEFVSALVRKERSDEVDEQLTKVFRAEQHLMSGAEIALSVAQMNATLKSVNDKDLASSLAHYHSQVATLLESADMERDGFSLADCEHQLDELQTAHDDIKALLLKAGAQLKLPIPEMMLLLDQIARIRHMVREMVKAIRYLNELIIVAEVKSPELALEAALPIPAQ